MPQVLAEYPASWGNQRVSVFVHRGPFAYGQVILDGTGYNPAGGDRVIAEEAGLKAFDALIVLGRASPYSLGFTVEALSPTGNSPGAGTSAVSVPSMILRWVNPDNGNEIATNYNLSVATIRLLAIGPK